MRHGFVYVRGGGEIDREKEIESEREREVRKRDRKKAEPVLLNVYGAPELIPRNEFRQRM